MSTARGALGVAVVGFGWMGEVHTRAHARLLHHYPAAPLAPRLVVAADPEQRRRDHAVQSYGFESAVADWTEVVARPDVDVVSVCGPNFVHREIAVAAAKAGKHVWVEKPAGRNLADTLEIADAVTAAGVMSSVGFNYRNAPAVEAARELVVSGQLGAVEAVSVEFLADYSAHPDGALSWRFDPEYAGTGVLGDLASHGFDLARHVAGEATGQVVDLVADTATFIPERPQASGAVSHYATASGGALGPVGNEDAAWALMRFESGARGRLEASRVAVGDQCRYRVEVRGTRGVVAWDFRRMQELQVCLGGDGYQDAAWETRFVGPGTGELASFQPGAGMTMGYDDLKVVECERLVRSIAEERPIGATIADAVVAARLIEAVVASSAARTWVTV
ncbi:MAG: Gfo/Idh/MocA family oxidoreductase [Nocardioidaceae bacterium]